jgi:uncharacterized protein (DUF2126 family)/transglutaminase-like putative cysteine protease
MAIRVALHHVTQYRYDRPVQLAPHVVRLRPAPHSRTPVTAYSLKVTPSEHFLNWQQDPFGNYQARLVFPKLTKEFKVEIDLVADMTTINPFDFFLEESAEHYPLVYDETAQRELRAYLELTEPGPKFAQLRGRMRDDVGRKGRRNIDVLVDINQFLQRTLKYDIRMEPGVFSPEETLTRGHGSCRDFAWLQVNLLRHLGFAARFVSGYSIQLRADVLAVDGPVGVLEDGTDLHAWAEVYLPGAGWVGLDATNGMMCGEGHIPLACTPDPGSAAPITGSYGWHKEDEEDELGEEFAVSMKVTRIEDRPRPTKPFSDEAWEALIACGDQVERALSASDVRLTMGGEPTFVATDDPEGDEWNTAALGPTKHKLGDTLLRRLHQRFAPGGMLHHGQGKWYPGEPLPRWAFSCYFRKDGEAIWRDPSLFADLNADNTFTVAHADKVMRALTRQLGLDERWIIPGYEDAFYYLWKERTLPVNVDPFNSKLEDPQERARLRRVFQQGLDSVVGYALPLAAAWEREQLRWNSGPWFLRDQRLYLLPGDSPLGYRLPLDSLPWSSPDDRTRLWERDPFAPRTPLPQRSAFSEPARQASGMTVRTGRALRAPGPGESADNLTRTALCVEARDGVVRVFTPPLTEIEAYLDLAARIESAAAETGIPILLEGYTPPDDPRVSKLSVTPDPGVIEVNIHPSRSWRELVSTTTALYDEARKVKLASDKFMTDGRHTGTGGGNHITLGGSTAADSPLLRRPDLVRSLSSYWLNHPALSYMFSGMFVGPTSQAPRVDEARHDALYELDLAIRALPERGENAPPWLVDRLFRHLFVDVTGNTHRTELCIDKLYSPDGASGRQGIVELRAFEMPPDSRMSCAAQLLVRGLLAWFWKEPYDHKVARWGTTLLDRFMLPHFLSQDFSDVVEDLRRAGFPFQQTWFEPQIEFRFPFLGRTQVSGLTLELRQAIEPWHVLGEEQRAGGTARYVDSSAERVQVLVRNMTDTRHVVACNGRRVPLHPTGTSGEYVAGVRYKAWKPPSSYHPTLPVDSPLVFDVLDTWSGRSLGGCTYHVAHPGGLSPDTFPRNALEAESRRVARFTDFGHTPGPQRIPEPERTEEFPLTLDLRRTPRSM